MKKLLLPAAFAVLAFTSCKKSSGDEAKSITKENIIGNFKMTAMTITYMGVQSDGLKTMDACAQDDIYGFKAADVFDYTDAGTKCDPNGDYSSTWTLTGDVLSMDGQSAKVTALTATKLETTETASQAGQTMTIKTTFARQ